MPAIGIDGSHGQRGRQRDEAGAGDARRALRAQHGDEQQDDLVVDRSAACSSACAMNNAASVM